MPLMMASRPWGLALLLAAVAALLCAPAAVGGSSSAPPGSCRDYWLKDNSSPDGWYSIDPLWLNQSFWVYCDMYHEGWTQVPPIVHSLDGTHVVQLPSTFPLPNPDLFPDLQMAFHGWGSAPAFLPVNVTYNITSTQLERLRAVSGQAKQSLYFHCKANLVNATYGCTVQPTFYPTHMGTWSDWYNRAITPEYLNDGCCFGCCRNRPMWDSTLVTFTQLTQLPVINVQVRHSGAPGEWLLVEPGPAWFQ
eukprot:RCo004255